MSEPRRRPPSTNGAKVLVVNGDDFGRSGGINRGILEAHDNGILTSASLMTLWPASAAAAESATLRPELAVGLHVDIGEWIFRGREWSCTYLRVPLDDPEAVKREVERQLRVFRRLLGRDPTHLDSHQHVHREEPIRSVLAAVSAALDVPLRHVSSGIRYCGEFFGHSKRGERNPQAVTVDALLAILEALPGGVTELACHPGYATDVATAYRVERELELRALCDARVRAAIESRRIALCSFDDIALAADPSSANT